MACRVVPFVAYKNYKLGNDTVARVGAHLYAVQDEMTGEFFAWCYRTQAHAERVANSLKRGPTTLSDHIHNWRHTTSRLTVSSIEE